jgi:hypothetical protein
MIETSYDLIKALIKENDVKSPVRIAYRGIDRRRIIKVEIEYDSNSQPITTIVAED